MKYGDKIPYESVTVVRAVGNSANAAVSAARLYGLRSALVQQILATTRTAANAWNRLKKDYVDTRIQFSTHKGTWRRTITMFFGTKPTGRFW